MSAPEPNERSGAEIYGKVTFWTESDGRLVSSQERGHANGEEWLTLLLVYAAFLMGEGRVEKITAEALRRVRKQKKSAARSPR